MNSFIKKVLDITYRTANIILFDFSIYKKPYNITLYINKEKTFILYRERNP